LRELDADQRARRIHAERELLDLGPGILSELPAPDLIPNPQVRSSVGKIRKILELRQATESVMPSTVTTVAGITLGDFFKSLEVQTANPIDVSQLETTQLQAKLSRAFRAESFWKVLEETSRLSGFRGDFRPDAPALRLLPSETSKLPRELGVTTSGPFRIALISLKQRDIVGSNQKRLRAEISVTPEPRLRALFLKFQAKEFSAIIEDGTTLQPADPEAQLDLPLGEGGHHVSWSFDFLVPKALSPDQIENTRIMGKATMQVAAGAAHIRIRNLATARGVARRRGGVTVSVLKVKTRERPESKRDLSVQIQVAYDTGGPAFESHRTWIFHNQVYLDPLEGESIPVNDGYDTDLQANGIVRVTYRFKDVTAPLDQLQFVYVAPTLIVDVPLEFELLPGQFLGVP